MKVMSITQKRFFHNFEIFSREKKSEEFKKNPEEFKKNQDCSKIQN